MLLDLLLNFCSTTKIGVVLKIVLNLQCNKTFGACYCCSKIVQVKMVLKIKSVYFSANSH